MKHEMTSGNINDLFSRVGVVEFFWLVGWLFSFFGISTLVGYLMQNPFLYK